MKVRAKASTGTNASRDEMECGVRTQAKGQDVGGDNAGGEGSEHEGG